MYLVTNTKKSKFRSFHVGSKLLIFRPDTAETVSPEDVKVLLDDRRFWQLIATGEFVMIEEK
jgi:hypothetical protein